MYGQRWNSENLRKRLILDRFLEKADRIFRNGFGGERDSLRNRYFMSRLPDMESTQKLMNQMVCGTKEFALVRFGLYEEMLCRQFLEIQNGLRKEYSDFIRYHIEMDAGMFSNDREGMDYYASHLLGLLNQADILAYWRNLPRKLVFGDFYGESVRYIKVEDLYPYPFWHEKQLPHWQKALSGKKVLIVSAFADTISKQYAHRRAIWNDDMEILPDFELIPFKAIQTSGGSRDKQHSSWNAAFQSMLDNILTIKFDIALISCGSYGTPLALALKKNGKKAIQWGGCFQLWFGIRGQRWDNLKEIAPYINDSWVYPSKEETPELAYRVNMGCYWAKNGIALKHEKDMKNDDDEM